MTTSTEDLGERVSRLEGGYEHVATKADIADTKTAIAEVRAEMAQMEIRVTIRLGALIVAASAAVVGLQKLLE